MKISRYTQINFLRDEYLIQKDNYQKIVNTSCRKLIEEGEHLFRGILRKIDGGKLYVKVRIDSMQPRCNVSSLTCFIVPQNFRSKDCLDNVLYKDIKENAIFSFDFTPVKILKNEEEKEYATIIFSSFEVDVANKIQSYFDTICFFGTPEPPLEMLMNLFRYVVQNESNQLLDNDYNFDDSNLNIALFEKEFQSPIFIENQLKKRKSFIIQGPPGTGKSYQISRFIEHVVRDSSVLVIALTNRALMEIIKKEHIASLLEKKLIKKTALTTTEKNEVPQLEILKEVIPEKGCCHFASFYKASSSEILKSDISKYDYVIVDEASQAYLPMLAITLSLGNYQLFVGDIEQLPPVVELNSDQILQRNYQNIVNGLNTVSYYLSTFQLNETFRLPVLSAECTSHFYKYPIKSLNTNNFKFQLTLFNFNFDFTPGNFIIFTKIEKIKVPHVVIDIAMSLLKQLYFLDPSAKIAILSHTRKLTAEMSKRLITNDEINEKNKSNTVVETVHRIQGLTVDYSIFTINDFSPHCLDSNFFNVATSRASKGCIIIADNKYLHPEYSNCDVRVKLFLKKIIEKRFYVEI